MRRIIYILLCTALFTSCQKEDHNGDLGGNWKLLQIEELDTDSIIDKRNEDCFWAIQLEMIVTSRINYPNTPDNFELLLSGIERKLRPDEIFYADYDRVDGITFSAGDKTLSVALTHDGSKITYTDKSGAELDYNAYARICEALEELSATSYTSVYDGDASFGDALIFKADFTFNAGEKTTATLEIRRYSEKYCVVSFMDRADQLVTLDKANALANLLSEYFK